MMPDFLAIFDWKGPMLGSYFKGMFKYVTNKIGPKCKQFITNVKETDML